MSTILSSLWGDVVGQVFLITIYSTIFGYLTLFGYISWFTGGKGGLAFRSTEFSLHDILGIFPTIISSILEIGFKYSKTIVRFVLMPFVEAFLLFIYLLVKYGIPFIPSGSQMLLLLASVYLLGFGFLFSSVDKKQKKASFLSLFLKLLLTIAGFFIFLVSIISPISINSSNYLVIIETFNLILIILMPVLFYYFGSKAGEIAFSSKLLTSVSQIIASYPVFGFETEGVIDNLEGKGKRNIVFLPKKSVMTKVINQPSETYYFEFENGTLFLIATLSKYSLFFRPESEKDGSAILISNEYLSSIKFYQTTNEK
jgi:hypothetical protein